MRRGPMLVRDYLHHALYDRCVGWVAAPMYSAAPAPPALRVREAAMCDQPVPVQLHALWDSHLQC
jgi:hypothetical protein